MEASSPKEVFVNPRKSVSVVLPAYNEEAIIGNTLAKVSDYLSSLKDRYDCEIIAVNDGSTDRTGDILDSFAAGHSGVKVIHHSSNKNLGPTLRAAFALSKADYIVTLDSDLSYGPDHIGLLVSAIERTQADIVIASPYMQGGQVTAVPRLRRLLSRRANKLLTLSAKGHLSTITGMARAYRRHFLQSLNLKSVDFEINTEIIYKAQLLRATIVEIPGHLDWSNQRAVGDLRKSSVRLVRGTTSQLFTSFLFRPFAFFILPGVIVFLLALYALFWAAYHSFDAWNGTGLGVTDAIASAFRLSPHSFIVGGFGLLAAIQMISLGIISAQNKRYFEETFHLNTALLRLQVESRESSRLGNERGSSLDYANEGESLGIVP